MARVIVRQLNRMSVCKSKLQSVGLYLLALLIFIMSCDVTDENKIVANFTGKISFEDVLLSSDLIRLGERDNSDSFVEKIDYYGVIDSMHYTVEYGSNRINQNVINFFNEEGKWHKKIDANDFLISEVIFSTYSYGDNRTINFVDPIRNKLFGIDSGGNKVLERDIPEGMRVCYMFEKDLICSPSMSSSYNSHPKYNFHRYDSQLNIVEQFSEIEEDLWGIPLIKDRIFVDQSYKNKLFLRSYKDVEYRFYEISENSIVTRSIDFGKSAIDKNILINAVKNRNLSNLNKVNYIKDIFAIHEYKDQIWGFLLGSQSNKYIFKVEKDRLLYKEIEGGDFMNDTFRRSRMFFRDKDGFINMSISQDAAFEYRELLSIDYSSKDNDLVFRFKINYETVFSEL